MANAIMLSVADACRALGIGRTAFYQAVSRGEIGLKKVGRRSLVLHADLLAWADRLPTSNGRELNSREENPDQQAGVSHANR